MAAGLVDPSGALRGSRPGADPAQWWRISGRRARTALEGPGRPGRRRAGPGRRPSDTVVACGVGCGGPMRAGGEAVSPLNITAWRDFPLRDRLAQLTGVPTFVDNDAKALALGEGWLGAAAGHENFVGMVVSTGVGGGIVLNGRLLDGGSGNAGHIGHVIVVPDGRACVCGGQGCLEAEASGTAIAAHHRSSGRVGVVRGDRANRPPGRSGGGVRGQPARSVPGRRQRIGRPGLRRALLRRRAT